ncbi:hypothetical protein KM043_011239 [Ampulex compressa]|nr:hypothetical protein KM043_011239 [Ampulex compressa]
MKFCVTCVYWTLLLISFVSSGLLFLIVASESVQSKDHSSHSNKNETFESYDNVTLESSRLDTFQLAQATTDGTKHSLAFENNDRDERQEEGGTVVSANVETFISDTEEKYKDLDTLAESLTQQPNLSQGGR